jgi:predicted metallo-beta-lactamase superfamily hydrolase
MTVSRFSTSPLRRRERQRQSKQGRQSREGGARVRVADSRQYESTVLQLGLSEDVHHERENAFID